MVRWTCLLNMVVRNLAYQQFFVRLGKVLGGRWPGNCSGKQQQRPCAMTWNAACSFWIKQFCGVVRKCFSLFMFHSHFFFVEFWCNLSSFVPEWNIVNNMFSFLLCWFALMTDTTNWHGFADQFIHAWFIIAFSPWAKTWTWLEWHSNHWVQGVCEYICALNTLKTIACWKTGSEPILHCCMKKNHISQTLHNNVANFLFAVPMQYGHWTEHAYIWLQQDINTETIILIQSSQNSFFFAIRLINIFQLRWNQSCHWFHCREMEAAFASNKLYWIRKTRLPYGSF